MIAFSSRLLCLVALLAMVPGAVLAATDSHSFANAESVRVRHLALDLTVDFERRVLSGHVDVAYDRVDPAARELILDTRDLVIRRVSAPAAGGAARDLEYEVGTAAPPLGAPLRIRLPAEGAPIRISYATSPTASGLQWVTPAQTAGKTRPFLYTQSQAIHARSWIPLQDTPQVRVTYTAHIRTPRNFSAVMSADNDPQAERDGDYRFDMPQAIPSYLIALAVGDLEFRPLGERTGVYAEPALAAAAAAEFADTEHMLRQVEKLYGAYRWGRYDLLVLPPSFPFGGMENPRISFVSTTLLAGDKSLVATIAHELAHSWSGNLVTNATWRDLWLNEGFTTYVTSRIMEAVYGAPRAAMEDVLSYQSLQGDLATFEPRDQILAIDLTGRDPDDVFTNVPYVKGSLLLKRLEQVYGRVAFDAFLQRYFERSSFQSITTEDFVAYLESAPAGANTRIDPAELRRWIHEPGLPATVPVPVSDAFARVAEAQRIWLEGKQAVSTLPTAAWTVHEWLYFLEILPDQVPRERLEELDRAFGLSASRNAEIAQYWYLVAIRNGYEPAYAGLRDYLLRIGRRKLVRPLYEELMKTPEGSAFARSVYADARPGYHPVVVNLFDGLVLGANQAARE